MMSLPELRAKVRSQQTRIPSLYGDIDVGLTPERFAGRMADESSLGRGQMGRRAELLLERELIERMRAYTMLGDVVADAYAALMPTYGYRILVSMLEVACDRGVEEVSGAPEELVAFLRDMEHVPDWLDMKLVEQGARANRNAAANLGPVTMRGAFVSTFMNKYAALPMALTGTLSNETAARRIRETAAFFATSVLPGALSRRGPGFKAAAMVRLMHSLVRFNALKRSGQWDVSVYGIPIPQLDQMPAGLIPVLLMSYRALAKGRRKFTRAERARVELARYRCYLLGLPQDLLADTPQGIVDVMEARAATLRDGYDDATCGGLLRATMAAYLQPDESIASRWRDRFERSFATQFFIRGFLGGDVTEAQRMGLAFTAADRARALACAGCVGARFAAYAVALWLPGLRKLADRALVRKIERQLSAYGRAEFTTDAASYRPVNLESARVA